MRMTRAALRAQAQDENNFIHEDYEADTTREDAGTIIESDRPALKDITNDNYPSAEDNPSPEEESVVALAKNKRKEEQIRKDDSSEETIQGNHEEQSQAVSRGSQDNIQQTPELAVIQADTMDDRTTSRIKNVAAQQIPAMDLTSTPTQPRNEAPKTPKFDPSIHTPAPDMATAIPDTTEDSFLDNIKSRSPSKMHSVQEDSRSPSSYTVESRLRTPRIEDSVEAIDALEDAIEEISDKIPDLDGLKIESPIKSRKNTPARVTTTKTPTALRKAERSPVKTVRTPSVKKAPKVTVKPAPAPRPSTVARNVPIARHTSKAPVGTKKPIVDGLKSQDSSASTLPPLTFSNSPARVPSQSNTTKKRVSSATLSTNKPAFIPSKSVKLPTKPTFSLPGEAISAKLKAQREERLKREEEAEKERKIFKARPVPVKVARPSLAPRENKASQARLSIYAGGVNKENVAPTKKSEAKQRPLSLSAQPDTNKANSSVRRITSATVATKPRVSSLQLTAGQKLSVTKEDVEQQKARGREVFARNKLEMDKLEKERKEKEDAARKARAEAAERGRQASREWAEKQKKKAALQNAAKMADSGQGLNDAMVAA
ncbi:hypothetical protein LTR10_021864 [Elasticomyces elasticus]|uniref:Carboxylesterase family protein n=1 Tax=Exophiala sideris TaxID=1016849 RepID=A0ABR0JRZ8_9EURO|nr:hypothetical protein LTR10_021864 [Elasticomyces elasticus]KAK5039825.1 hypothetical protein LTS07_000320 [Exophiala sideris]KAK5041377.1 hypothetical protein LTR13_002852 [Exophiala sideris]KAK5068204.1 hypothetical protein LTR69_000322 [Exophiala sideris]KAK5187505.1 hypothetical protein LTR44_000321 [Eurotiomycetes sp. CCFEE 6388]